MTLSRRGIFGAAAGAVVAGPGLARDVGQTLQTVSTPAYYDGSAKMNDANCKLSDPKWEAEQIARAKRRAAGDFSDEDRCYPTEGPPDPYAPLKSTSDAARRFMRERRSVRRWEDQAMKSARDALDHYDKTGILRHFF